MPISLLSFLHTKQTQNKWRFVYIIAMDGTVPAAKLQLLKVPRLLGTKFRRRHLIGTSGVGAKWRFQGNSLLKDGIVLVVTGILGGGSSNL